jgi:hypothetical protein
MSLATQPWQCSTAPHAATLLRACAIAALTAVLLIAVNHVEAIGEHHQRARAMELAMAATTATDTTWRAQVQAPAAFRQTPQAGESRR